MTEEYAYDRNQINTLIKANFDNSFITEGEDPPFLAIATDANLRICLSCFPLASSYAMTETIQ
jgi:hypothetical protein